MIADILGLKDYFERLARENTYLQTYDEAVERFKIQRVFEGLSWDGPTDEKITIRRPIRALQNP